MDEISLDEVEEFIYVDREGFEANHAVTPIGYTPLTFEDIQSIKKHNKPKFKEDFDNSSKTSKKHRFSGLTSRETRFLKRAEPLKYRERFPNVPVRKQILMDYDSRRYGCEGTNSLLDKPDYVINRTFNRILSNLIKKTSQQ